MNRHVVAAAHTSAQKRTRLWFDCPAVKHFVAIESPTKYEVTCLLLFFWGIQKFQYLHQIF